MRSRRERQPQRWKRVMRSRRRWPSRQRRTRRTRRRLPLATPNNWPLYYWWTRPLPTMWTRQRQRPLSSPSGGSSRSVVAVSWLATCTRRCCYCCCCCHHSHHHLNYCRLDTRPKCPHCDTPNSPTTVGPRDEHPDCCCCLHLCCCYCCCYCYYSNSGCHWNSRALTGRHRCPPPLPWSTRTTATFCADRRETGGWCHCCCCCRYCCCIPRQLRPIHRQRLSRTRSQQRPLAIHRM